MTKDLVKKEVKMVKEDAKTLGRWDVKSVLESDIGEDVAVLGEDYPPLPSLIREGGAPTLTSGLGDLHKAGHSEAAKLGDPSLTLRMTRAEESPLKIFNFPFSIFHLKNSQFKKVAFTLAEVLITLGVIGVVAAITMPVLINHIKDQQYDRARQKALTSIGEAGRLIAVQGDMDAASNAEDFVKNILSKKLSITKMCDADHLSDCGWADEITVLGKGENMQGNKIIAPPKTITDIANYVYGGSTTNALKSQKSYGFVTANGYSVDLFYNPNCITDTNKDNRYGHDYVCMNAIYDMNGKANPNEVGKDIGFVTVLYPDETNRAVAPNPVASDVSGYKTWEDANKACSEKGYTLPDKEELQSLSYNLLLTNLTLVDHWSGSITRGQAEQTLLWSINTLYGVRYIGSLYGGHLVRCVRR